MSLQYTAAEITPELEPESITFFDRSPSTIVPCFALLLLIEYTELCHEIDGLRRYIEELGEHLKAFQDSLAKETKAEIGLLAEKVGTQNAYLRQILQRGAQSTEAQGSTFPISSPEEMMALDLKISKM
ncbi:hypothetical protein ACLKA7_000830 [Drosophila subpalustris]